MQNDDVRVLLEKIIAQRVLQELITTRTDIIGFVTGLGLKVMRGVKIISQ